MNCEIGVVGVEHVCARAFRICLQAKEMSGIKENCSINLDVRRKIGGIWVQRGQKMRERVFLCYVRDVGGSLDREIKRTLVMAEREVG